MDFVQAAVCALVAVFVFLVAAVVAEGADGLCQVVVVGGNRTGVADGAEVFAGVEAETCCVAPVAGFFAVDLCAVGLGGVFQYQQVMTLRDAHDGRHVGELTVEMDGQDGARFGRNGGFGLVRAEVVGCFVRFDEDWRQPVFSNGENAGDVGVGGHDDFVAFLDPALLFPGTQRERECIEAVGHANAVLRAAVFGEFVFEGFVLLAVDVPAGVNDAGGGFDELFAVLGVAGFEV